jgi:IS5 family transposase
MNLPGLFDFESRMMKIDKNGDPLSKISSTINWEIFRPELEKARNKERKGNSGPKGYDAVLMFKILILQSLYNLSDDALEFQIFDRHSFCRFLGLHLGSKIPDATTVWRFREDLTKAGIVEQLFDTFDTHLRTNGFEARKGQIVDASIVNVPKQRNTREENKHIKDGEAPKWPEHKKCQKDIDARWTKKNGKTFFGYKNHISVDAKHKFIRSYGITSASVHDSNVFLDLLDDNNTSRDVWADSAYRSQEKLDKLDDAGYREHIQRKGNRGRKLTPWEQKGNHTRSKTRSRVEHVFGVQAQKAGNLLLRTVGILRAKAKIGLRNLAYNIDRFGLFTMSTG